VSPPRGRRDPLSDDVLEDVEELGDAELAPSLPSAALFTAAGGTGATGEIWSLAWPVILSQMLVSAVSLVDIAMVGRLTRDALAAVGYVTQFVWLSQSVLFAVGIACVALMSRAVGAGDTDRARRAFAGTLVVATGIGACFTAVAWLAPAGLLRLLDAQPEVVALAVPYLVLVLGVTPVLAVSITLESALRALKDTRRAMWIATAVTVVKTLLNAVLIFGLLGAPRLELVGAGISTVVSLVMGMALFVWAVRRPATHPSLRVGLQDFARARRILPDVVRISLPAVGERVVMNAAMMSYFTLLGAYGSAAIAAYTVGIRILSFSWIPGVGFSVASATLVGQALGAHDPEAARRAGLRSVGLAVSVSVLLGAAFALAREPLARTFTSDAAVIAELVPFMLLLALAQPLLGVHFTLAGALRGAGDTMSPLLAASVGNWVFRVPLAWACVRMLDAPVTWVWWCLVVDHLARSLWLAVVFGRGRWRERLGAAV